MRRTDAILVAAALVSTTAWFVLRRLSPPTAPSVRATARPLASSTPLAASTATKSHPRASPPARTGVAPPAAGLTVEADVPGADVFLDRVYKGKAPVTLGGLAPGPHRLNVSAEGYDGYAETVDVSGAPQVLAVRLKQVRLEAGIDVVHKHGLGSCRGRLSATPAGLRYAASKPEDAFDVPLSSVERLEADYLKKSLSVKLRGGRSYNFAEASGNADALLAFQQSVSKAQARLAAAP
ncbi:MAG TPA: PEGA domain-containing protein [Vicinamibacteria bacterium]|nr:PEGA domain-containing protein [Vicinamibacteria bacterium]